MSRLISQTLSIAAATAVSFGSLVSASFAGSYIVSACSPSSAPGLWAQTNTFSAALAADNRCGGPAIGATDGSQDGSLYAEDVLNSPVNIPHGARAGWTLVAPAGTTITAISYYRTFSAYNNPNMISGLFQADGTPLEQCKIPWPFVSGSSNRCDRINDQAPATFTGLSTGSLFLGVACRIVDSALACIAGGAPLHAATARVYSARVTLSESGTPTLGDVAGPLWGGGEVAGTVPVTFTASDASGIREQAVRSDSGQTVGSAVQSCDFGNVPPCPQQLPGSLSVDTTRVSDGPHTFSLVVTDAAGNTQVATSPTVVVNNGGPPPPAALTATAKGGGSNVVALAWRNPVGAPAPITGGRVQLCQTTCPAAVAVGASGAAQVTAPGPGLYTVRLWLVDSQGRGGPHNAALATVTVPPPAGGSSATTRTKITARLTGRRLRVAGTVARTGRVRVSWRSKVKGRTVGSGSRVVSVRANRIGLTFTLSSRARRGTVRVAVRAGGRIVGQARAVRSR